MKFAVINAHIFSDGAFIKQDFLVDNGKIVFIGDSVNISSDCQVFDFNNCYVFPGFTDVHVHLREPGFSYKETIKTGTAAAAAGGYTAVCTMPNLNPVPDTLEHLNEQLEIIKRDASIAVYPFGAITTGEKGESLSDMEALSEYVIGFSDDGRGVQSDCVMLEAMKKAGSLNKIMSAHCEDNSLIKGGYINDGFYCKEHNHRGISNESEYAPIARDIALLRKSKCSYHVCHVSTKESVEIIRNAKREGLDITCETAPHYLLLDDSMLKENGAYKMNPPLRDKTDREALIEGIIDGTIDMIATDHAPHSAEEKSKGLENSLMGITGIECSFALLYTGLVKTSIITLSKLITLMSEAPSKRLGIDKSFENNATADFTVFDLNEKYCIDSSQFISMGKSTPFNGEKVYARCLLTVYNGKPVYIRNK